MKKNIVKLLISMAIVGFGVISPASAAFISLTNPKVSPKPLNRIENNGEGQVSFALQETSAEAAPAKDNFGEANIRISVELNKLALKNDDVSLITGTMMDYFSASYNADAKRLILTQIAEYPAFGNAQISIPVAVTANSLSTDNSLNGFNANISANDADTTANGNAAEFTYTEDAAIVAPEITSMDTNSADNVLTNNNLAVIAGTCTSGNEVTITIDGVTITPKDTCSVAGTFSITPTNAIRDGKHDVVATQKDEDGQVSSPSPTDELTVDTLAGTKPVITIVEDINNDTKIDSTELVGDIDVKVELPADVKINDTLIVTDATGNEIENLPVTQTMIDNGHNFTIAPPAVGTTITLKSKLIDLAGNESPESSDSATLIDTNPPTLTLDTVDGKTSPVNTANNKPEITGTCEDGGTVTAYIDAGAIVPTAVCTNGVYTIIPTEAITDGTHTVTTKEVDNAGNTVSSSPIQLIIATEDTDGDNISDAVDLDDDNDGILDTVEEATSKHGKDTDQDGIPDSKDLDSDNDGISDLFESGQDASSVDTDNDGVLDDTTDTNNNGVMDSVDVENGGTKVAPVDTDNDSVPDFQDIDSDNDSILDETEGIVDTDNDGKANYVDTDSDGDTIPDATEGTVDTDNDGKPNYVDLDSDGDSIPDETEGTVDTDNDGEPNYLDTDSDADTIPDATEGTVDTDNDGKPNYIDVDSDNDGDLDSNEGTEDRDNDGLENYVDADDHDDTDGDNILDTIDLDDDNDGILDTVEEATATNNGDTDQDGIVDSKDLDSDNDGISDLFESGQDVAAVDKNADGKLDDTTDTNNNGVMDSVDASLNGTTVEPVDTDNDNTPDFQDLDSDADNIPDAIEGIVDTDSDGKPNYVDTDSDDDGIPDETETANDFDKDGKGNYIDLDSDADNILDAEEGTDDEDGDGKPNYLDAFIVVQDLYAGDDTLIVKHYGKNVGYVSSNDAFVQGGSIWEINTQPAYGEVEMDQATGKYTYSPEANYNGEDSFTYSLRDQYGNRVTATVFITVNCAASQTSDNGSAFNVLSMLAMMFMTGMAGLYFIRREERGEA